MCGIAAQISLRAQKPIDQQKMRSAISSMEKRGPDGSNMWISPDSSVALGHVRLAIIDPDARSAQPMTNANENLHITYNGEIYNFRDLKTDLIRKGASFRTDSDTEVLLLMYQFYGIDMLFKLRGMFAFVIYDSERKRVFAARDSFGIKPLYYCETSENLFFASQVKTIKHHFLGDQTNPQPAGVVGFFLFGSVPEPYTLHKEVFALPAGHYLEVQQENGQYKISSYETALDIVAEAQEQSFLKKDYSNNDIKSALLETMEYHLVSDVPSCLFLSSGIDSCLLLALAYELGRKDLCAVTLGFQEFKGTDKDEVPYASDFAKKLGINHKIRYVSKDEFDSDIETLLADMDQPSIDGINTWYIAKAVKEHGYKVALSGLGGDELLGGYPSFSDVPQWATTIRRTKRFLPFLSQIGLLLGMASRYSKRIPPKLPGLLSFGQSVEGAYFAKRGLFMPWELGDYLDEVTIRQGLATLSPLNNLCSLKSKNISVSHAKISALEAGCYMKNQLLRDADWAGMGHSIEIRTPLVDRVLWKKALPMILQSKLTNKKSWIAGLASKLLEQKLLNREKTGFETPIGSWMLEKSRGVKKSRVDGAQHWSRTWARCVFSDLGIK